MTDNRKKPGVAFWATVGLVVALVGSLAYVRVTDAPSPAYPNGQFWPVTGFVACVTVIAAGLWRIARTRGKQ